MIFLGCLRYCLTLMSVPPPLGTTTPSPVLHYRLSKTPILSFTSFSSIINSFNTVLYISLHALSPDLSPSRMFLSLIHFTPQIPLTTFPFTPFPCAFCFRLPNLSSLLFRPRLLQSHPPATLSSLLPSPFPFQIPYASLLCLTS